ncbi:MAG: hypothetical protein EZS28_008900 [Streblomastix strix]|uniref:Mos1 transposase HTH domain-containing protein n=1 Tax=Streblomastix strix TaxID=222440 RepID=A0A5J4WMH6_9EUKA|nr:MAG: hypothetical protein EZS28_008900 [Streblomastix strix]
MEYITLHQIDWIRYRSVVDFMFRQGNIAIEVFDIMNRIYQGRAPEFDTIIRWKNKFSQGLELVYAMTTPGRMPIIGLGPEIIKLMQQDQYISIKRIAAFLGHAKSTIVKQFRMKLSIIVFIQSGFHTNYTILQDTNVFKGLKLCFKLYENKNCKDTCIFGQVTSHIYFIVSLIVHNGSRLAKRLLKHHVKESRMTK